LDLGGYPVVLADTAGLRGASEDPIEQEGMRRAWQRAEAADLRLLLVEAGQWPNLPEDLRALAEDRDSILIVSKSDLRPDLYKTACSGALPLSVATGAGVPDLLRVLTERVTERLSGGASMPLTRLRHRQALE